MARVLRAVYADSNECEVTGKVSLSSECSETELDGAAVGRRVFPDTTDVNVYGCLRIESITPAGVTIVNTRSNERYVVADGEEYCTGRYTFNGRYYWWFTFEILNG